MEEKEQASDRLNGESPDLCDALCLTFAQPVAPRLPWLDQRTGHAILNDEDRHHDIPRALMDRD